MALVKRFSFLSALVVVLVVGLSAPGEAQGRGGHGSGGGQGGGARSGGGGGGRPAGGGTVVVARPVYGRPYYGYYGRPYYGYSPYWYGFGLGYLGVGYGYYGYYGYPYGVYGYPPYGGYPYRYTATDSSMRLEVTPKEAEVYVDGYYAGVVDDFDGTFQRLRVPPGSHELTLYHDGYRAVHQTIFLQADSTFKVRYNMEKLAPGDVAEQRPVPKEPPPEFQGGAPLPNQPGAQQGNAPRAPVGRPLPPPPPTIRAGQPGGSEPSSYGTLALRVQPGNATVLIDGERWDAPQGGDRLILELAEGTHHVQVQRDGFDSYSNDVAIRRGETTPLNISLRTR